MDSSINSDDADIGLVEKFIKKRDERAFRALYRRHTPNLYRLALRLAGGAEVDAQDIIQDMWLRASRVLPDFEWKSSLRTWLTGILINCARELERSRKRRREEELPGGETDGPIGTHAFRRAASTAGLTEIEQLILRLPDGCRHVLTLHDIEGYTHEEIGELLEISAGTSKSQLHYAREILRSALQEEGKNHEQRNGRQT